MVTRVGLRCVYFKGYILGFEHVRRMVLYLRVGAAAAEAALPRRTLLLFFLRLKFIT